VCSFVSVDSTFSECRASTLMGPTAVSGHLLRSIISIRNVAHQLALVFVSLSARERVLFVCFSRVSRLDRQRQFAACLLLACFFCSLFCWLRSWPEVLDRFLLAFGFFGRVSGGKEIDFFFLCAVAVLTLVSGEGEGEVEGKGSREREGGRRTLKSYLSFGFA